MTSDKVFLECVERLVASQFDYNTYSRLLASHAAGILSRADRLAGRNSAKHDYPLIVRVVGQPTVGFAAPVLQLPDESETSLTLLDTMRLHGVSPPYTQFCAAGSEIHFSPGAHVTLAKYYSDHPTVPDNYGAYVNYHGTVHPNRGPDGQSGSPVQVASRLDYGQDDVPENRYLYGHGTIWVRGGAFDTPWTVAVAQEVPSSDKAHAMLIVVGDPGDRPLFHTLQVALESPTGPTGLARIQVMQTFTYFGASSVACTGMGLLHKAKVWINKCYVNVPGSNWLYLDAESPCGGPFWDIANHGQSPWTEDFYGYAPVQWSHENGCGGFSPGELVAATVDLQLEMTNFVDGELASATVHLYDLAFTWE